MEAYKKRRRRTLIYLWILLGLLVLLVAATYTWFSLSQTPRVNDLAMYVNAESGLELATRVDAPDGEWGQKIDFPDLVDDDYPLKPASWSDARQSFVAIRYGLDGRLTDEIVPLSDGANANRKDGYGYYVVGTFYARTLMPCSVSLAEAVELNEGENGAGTYVIGTPLWNDQELIHKDGGSGAECAVRLGFRITPVDDTGNAIGNAEFFMYEPNCDVHIEDAEGYVDTPSVDETDTLVPRDHMILQRASTWTEAYPVQREVTIKSLGEFTQNRDLFSLERGKKVKIELYVWLEGQDVDCTNRIEDAMIMSNIQFHVEYGGQSGLDEIPND